MGKDSRLSFRISNTLSDRVDRAIDRSDGQIRDRSEFGTKAVTFFLDYIENAVAEDELILNAILGLAKHVGEYGEEVEQIRNILQERTMIPSVLSSNKLPETHPDFQKLLGLMDQIRDEEMHEDLTNRLRDASYEDIGSIYKEYSDAFFLGNRGPLKNKNIEN